MTAEAPKSPRLPQQPTPCLVARWDLDKTYLRTEFHTLRDLLGAAFERPDQKRAVPGAARLLRELRREGARIHILSGSPRQMRRVLAERLLLDGVRYDELTLKPNLYNLLHLRFRLLKDQLSYKLPALLEARMHERHGLGLRGVPEVLVGDDSEADAFIYSLYADICSGQVDSEHLANILDAGQVDARVVERCLEAVRSLRPLPTDNGVASFRILIHLDQQSPPSRFARYGRRLVPFYNYGQAALVLLEDGFLSASATYRVAQELCNQFRFDLESLARSYLDLLRRGHLSGQALTELARGQSVAAPEVSLWPERIRQGLSSAEASRPPSIVTRLDYVELAAHHRGGKNRRR